MNTGWAYTLSPYTDLQFINPLKPKVQSSETRCARALLDTRASFVSNGLQGDNQMDEEQIVKEALRLEYLREIVKKWIDNGKLEEDEVHVDEKGRVIIETSPRALVPVLTELANELAVTKAEFWWKTNIQKETENREKGHVSAVPQ